ncbi:lipopolysaccharide-binding protein-like [Actinia tenebrosa]|uniref:Lipopolysaccharide-binding protein-like n=1 Tax=Actinia tenebrosa TaxID=6105 RepID=A0A6P8J2U5_ACTTE|nr:lipopolysaccharide-binding protein-like [Actinia tenebrosa]
MWMLVCVVITVCYGEARSSLPSPSEANVRLFLTKKGIDYANQRLMSNIVSEVEGLRIPSVSITKSIWWNRIDLSLYNSKVNKVNLGSSSLSFGYGHMKLSLHLSSAEIVGKYNYRGGIIGWGRGTYRVKLTRVSLTKYLSLGANAKGKPYIKNRGCNTWIGDIDPIFRGESSFILNLFVQLVKTSVQQDVQKMICKSITDGINERGRKLPQMYQDKFPVTKVASAEIHFPILESPSIQRGFVDFVIEGGVYSSLYTLTSATSGQGINHLSYYPNPYKMLSIVLSDRMFNSLAELYYKAGVVRIDEIQINDVNPSLKVNIDLVRPPFTNTNASGSFFTLYLNGTVKDNSSNYEVGLLVTGDFRIQEEDRVLSGKVSNLRFNLTDCAENAPKDLRDIIVPSLFSSRDDLAEIVSNSFMNDMAPLPLIPTVKIVNKRVLYEQGYTVFECDLVEKK